MGIFGFGRAETLYFPGCYSSSYLTDKVENYKRILKKLKMKFETIKDLNCCGGFLDESGYEQDLRKLARQNFELLKNKETQTIITNCPLCLYTFSERYKDLLSQWNIKVEFILATILRELREDSNLIKSYTPEEVCYYDSCYLARYSKLIDEPREILRMMGYRLIELPKNKEETLCCGSCGGLSISNKELSDKISEDFIRILIRKKIKKVIVSDPRAYKVLRDSLERLGIKDIIILEISEVICDALDLSRE